MAVTRLEITAQGPYAGGQSFGEVGAYEHLAGTAHFAVNPDHPANLAINDLELAPRNADGQVSFSADFQILKPVIPQKGNGRLLLDVPNRGRPRAMKVFNNSPDSSAGIADEPGTGFLMRRGYTVVWCGWQHDVPAGPGLLRIQVPEAATPDGQPISGRVMVTFQPSSPSQVQFLSDRNHLAYPADNLEDWDSVLTVQEHEDAPKRVIPREEWSFRRLEGERAVPDRRHIYMASGFIPGQVYRVIYDTTGAPVVGLGLLATRDIASFLRHGTQQEGNPCEDSLERAYAFGQSQSGRFLRLLLYLGLNQDEQDRAVFDGLIPHVGGGHRGEFNHRFAQPSSLSNYSANNLFPFSDTDQTDPVTGRTDGLLSRLARSGRVPKIMLTNTPTEYWGGHCALIHSDVSGRRDLAPSESIRIYYFAGTQHASGSWPLTSRDTANGNQGQQPFNWVDYRPLLRAALVNLDSWVSHGAAPPANWYPRIEDGTLVPPEQLYNTFRSIPGVNFPEPLRRILRLDFGADEGRPTKVPPEVGDPYPNLVAAVDRDGNDTSGILLPAISVPVATCTGWNLRHRNMGGTGQILGNTGSTIPFAATRAQREADGDPRPSLEDRYATREDYLEQVSAAASALVAQGYLLEEDLDTVAVDAGSQYDLVQARAREPQTADD